jgi:hypothetical protein
MRRVWLGCSILGFVLACGGSDGNGGSGGAFRDKPIDELTPAEREQACTELEAEYRAYAASLVEQGVCTFTAVLSARASETDEAALRTRCSSERDACLEQLDQNDGFVCAFPDDCGATVAELVLCYDELSLHYADVYDAAPACETLTLASAQALTIPEKLAALPASCSSAQTKCAGDDAELDPEPADPSTAACLESCERFETTCGLTMDPSCGSWCNTERLLGERNGCLEINQSFYECGRSAELECSQDNVRLAIDGACGILDVTFCQSNEGVTCSPTPGYDSYCADELPALPEAFQCVSTVPFGSCVDHPGYGGIFRCCPAGTTF